MQTALSAETRILLDFSRAEDQVALAAAVAACDQDLDLAQRLAAEVATHGKGRYSPALKAEVAARAAALAGRSAPALPLETPLAEALIAACTAAQPTQAEAAQLLDQSALLARQAPPAAQNPRKIAIIGAGVSGIAAAHDLRAAGHQVVIFEASSGVSGAWNHNRYPGCGVDSPSYVYSFSWAQKPDWTRYFVRRNEIDGYINAVADAFGLRPLIRFDTQVTACRQNADLSWQVTSHHAGNSTEERFDILISAVGQLNKAAYPAIKGLGTFKGDLVHTAEWRPEIDYRGKRVAVVGVGASAMQVAPTIAPEVAQLTVYQRQPHWVMPNRQYLAEVAPEEIALLQAFPAYLAWKRLNYNWTYGDVSFDAVIRDPNWHGGADALNAKSAKFRDIMSAHIARELAGHPDLIAAMTPDYPPYSKRVLLDNNWYKTFLRENVSLETGAITEITETGIRTAKGEQALDLIILATGFQASRMLQGLPIENAKGARLQEIWGEDDARAHLGVTVPDFANLFLLYGPNTNLAFGGSAIIHSEIQAGYITRCLALAEAEGATAMECRRDAYEAYNAEVDQRLATLVWSHSPARSWFTNAAGRVTTNSPWSMGEYWARLAEPQRDDFHFHRR